MMYKSYIRKGVSIDWHTKSKINGTDFTVEEVGLHLWAQQKGQYNEAFYFILYLSQFALRYEMKIMGSSFEGVIFRDILKN